MDRRPFSLSPRERAGVRGKLVIFSVALVSAAAVWDEEQRTTDNCLRTL